MRGNEFLFEWVMWLMQFERGKTVRECVHGKVTLGSDVAYAVLQVRRNSKGMWSAHFSLLCCHNMIGGIRKGSPSVAVLMLVSSTTASELMGVDV